MQRPWKLAGMVLVFLLVATACPAGDDGGTGAQDDGDADSTESVLQTVTDRGRLVCGVNDQVPGFGFVDQEGNASGFDVDFCKVIAAAVLGDAEAVDYQALTAEQRFTALQSNEIDVLVRNTTWTASRDGGEGASFATTTFYDGQGMMVKADAGIGSLEDLGGDTICVLTGTTTEVNLEAQFQARGIDYTPLTQDRNETLQQAFTEDRCQGWTSDKSQLAGIRSNWPENQGGPQALQILDVTLSKEPLGPVTRDGDSDWYDAVNWAVIATIQAEEFGITQENVDDMRSSEDPEIRRFLGEERTEAGEPFDAGLNLPSDFAYQVVKQVGNYEEIYNRNVGPDTALGLERGVNQLWTEGGLLYPPPYR